MANMLHMLSCFELISPLKHILHATEMSFDVNAREVDGRKPISLSASAGHEGVVELLLSTDKIDVNARDLDSLTLHSRAVLQEIASVDGLLLSIRKLTCTRGTD